MTNYRRCLSPRLFLTLLTGPIHPFDPCIPHLMNQMVPTRLYLALPMEFKALAFPRKDRQAERVRFVRLIHWTELSGAFITPYIFLHHLKLVNARAQRTERKRSTLHNEREREITRERVVLYSRSWRKYKWNSSRWRGNQKWGVWEWYGE